MRDDGCGGMNDAGRDELVAVVGVEGVAEASRALCIKLDVLKTGEFLTGAFSACSSIVAALSNTEIISLGVIAAIAEGIELPFEVDDVTAALFEPLPLDDAPTAAISITPVNLFRNIVALAAMLVTRLDMDCDTAGLPLIFIIDCGIFTGGTLEPG